MTRQSKNKIRVQKFFAVMPLRCGTSVFGFPENCFGIFDSESTVLKAKIFGFYVDSCG